MRELDNNVVLAASDQGLHDNLIRQNETFILKCASLYLHKYISKSDDEWSIALCAFSQAINEYRIDKGSFLSFAKMIIQRRLTDYLRSQEKYKVEISIAPESIDLGTVDDEDKNTHYVIMDNNTQIDIKDIILEIKEASEIFHRYGFSFSDLHKCSPHAKKTRKYCAQAVIFLIQNPFLINNIKESNNLPIKIIEKSTKIPRKIIERHRKYIIAATEILSGEYPCLSEYMQYIKEEMNK